MRQPLASLKELAEAAGREFSRLEITVGLSPGVGRDPDTVRRFADAGVHRLVVFAPGFMPRSRFESDLFPTLERFADAILTRV